MSQPLASGVRALEAPRFYVTPKQRFSVGSLVLALVIALLGLAAVLYALRRSHSGRASMFGAGGTRFGTGGPGGDSADDDDDDPSRVDTIYLGGPSEAPVATRPGGHPSAVHPFVVVHLPRSGEQVGQIPNTPAGQMLYGWLAAFNSRNLAEAGKGLPMPEADWAEAAQVELRKETGGFSLMSAKEVQPGVLVFRLHDQTTAANEVLGTLQVRPDSSPASLASFSLRAVSAPQVPAQ